MELTSAEKQMKTAALLYAVAFIFTAVIVFICLPDVLFESVNFISGKIFPSLPPYPLGENKFWLSMTVSMMAGVTITALLIYKDIRKYYTMAIPLVVMKFTSSFCGLVFFITGLCVPETQWHTLSNLVIFITDFPLGALMLYLFYRVNLEYRTVSDSIIHTMSNSCGGPCND